MSYLADFGDDTFLEGEDGEEERIDGIVRG